MAAEKKVRRPAQPKRQARAIKPKPRKRVAPIPKGFHTVTSYLFVSGAAYLIEYLRAAFDAEVLSRHLDGDGRLSYALLKIGDSLVMASEPREPWKPMPCGIYLYVKDTDATYRNAMAAGGVSLMEPADQFYGDRNAGMQDPSGNQWWIATHIEDLTPKELERRMRSM
jgi:PhnB protein